MNLTPYLTWDYAMHFLKWENLFTFATLAIAAGCWFGPAWTCDCPVWTNAAWPSAGHTVLGSMRRTSMGDAAVEDEDASNW